MQKPNTHRFQIRIEWRGDTPKHMMWRLPVWTPGSYLIREFSRHIEWIQASSGTELLPIHKIDKATFEVQCPENTSLLTLTYEVFAYDLSVRTSYLDTSRGYFNGANVFLYPDTDIAAAIELEVIPDTGWDVATALPRLDKPGYCFIASDYDTLVDSPVEAGHFQRYIFEACDVRHELIFTGFEDVDLSALVHDIPRIVEAAQSIFQSPLPYTRYVFLVHGQVQSGGGLEHRNSASIMFDPFMLHDPEKYSRILGLFAHEYFHLWNVKRLRPTYLGPFDYQHEVYTPLLWVLEGWTDYYAWILLARSGVVESGRVLDYFAEAFRQLDLIPARHQQSLTQSSFDTWIKLYRPDGNTPNNTISYYHKGALVALALDLSLRRATGGRESLDSVLRVLWTSYGDQGYPDTAVDSALVQIGGPFMRQLLDQWVYGTEDIPDDVFDTVGLKLLREFKNLSQKVPYTGIVAEQSAAHSVVIKHVLKGSPAESAGLAPGDEWIALNNYRIPFDAIEARLSACSADEPITITIFRHHELHTFTLTPDSPLPDRWRFVTDPLAAEEARTRFTEWMGTPIP